MYIMVPYVVFLQKDSVPRWCTVLYLYMITGTKTLCGALSSPQIMLLIHNSSPLHCRAVINGATISIQASARFLGPLFWGYIMSWAQENDVAWVSWWTLGFICLIALYQSYKISPIDEDDTTGLESEPGTTSEECTHRPLLHRSSLSSLSNKRP